MKVKSRNPTFIKKLFHDDSWRILEVMAARRMIRKINKNCPHFCTYLILVITLTFPKLESYKVYINVILRRPSVKNADISSK